ncbi:hypothetical protein JW799_14365 [Cohnella algarum]|nr:hypothetical protein [Cohnella algarum]
MPPEREFLVRQAMRVMDRNYDEQASLVRETEGGELSTRSSAHYALGLLIRGEPGDREKASAILQRVLDMQLDAPDEIYHGTFRVSPEAPVPPAGHMAWGTFPPGIAYSIHTTMEAVFRRFAANIGRALPGLLTGEAEPAVRDGFRHAVNEVLPPVWESYDPNWREFIACTFALLLDRFEAELPPGLVARIDGAMGKAVGASLARRLSQSIPMNTNIELMHAFIVHYYGHRYRDEAWIEHAEREAERLLAAYREFDSFPEFNSTTYYGVDLTVLGMWREHARTESFRSAGKKLESGLWRNLADFYHPGLENVAGPFSRAYDMEMKEHSSLGVFLYLALGESCRHLAVVNCETSHDPLIALVGVDVPEDVLPRLREFGGERHIRKSFRELCERDKPGANTHLCRAEAWIGRDLMIGAMSGSRNTSGQLHPATIHWRTESGERYSLRLLRRAKGEQWSRHLRGVTFEAKAAERRLEAEICVRSDEEIEVFFEVSGPCLEPAQISEDRWSFPGLSCIVSAEAPQPAVRMNGGRLEIVYPCRSGPDAWSRLRFELQLETARL